MLPQLRIFGTLLRLIGISSPEDTSADIEKSGDSTRNPPSWRKSAPSPVGDSQPKPPAA
jgi:hypothetical protein